MKQLCKPIVLLSLCAAVLTSCSKVPDGLPSAGRPGSVRFTFEAPAAMIPVRGTDPARESGVQDVNLWLTGEVAGITRHRYLSDSGEVTLELPAGTYDYYALANAGTDMGECDAATLEELSLALDPYADFQEGGRFLMASRGSFTVPGATTVPVRLVRCAAKVELALSVAPAFAPEFTLTRVQALGVPALLRPFGDNRTEDLAALADYPAGEVTGTSYNGTFYLPENLAGENTAITDPRERSRANAPKGAACFRIEGTAGGRKVDYFVYPGANVTSDFNLHRNRHYRIEAVITGLNTVDTRVSTTEAELSPWQESYAVGATARSILTLSCVNNPDNRFELSYEPLSGSGTMSVDGQALAPGVPLRLTEGGGEHTAEIAYTQQEEGEAEVRLLVTDRYGFTVEKRLATSFVKEGPQVTFEQRGDSLYAFQYGILDLHIEQPGYTGKYTVTAAGYADVYYDCDTPATEFTLPGNGDYLFGFSPVRPGLAALRLTLTDELGRSAPVLVRVVGLMARAQISAGYTGGSLQPLVITVRSSCPVGEDLDVSLLVPLAKLTAGGQETATEWVERTLTIYEGDTEASWTPLPGSAYMGYVVKGGITIKALSKELSADRMYRYEITN